MMTDHKIAWIGIGSMGSLMTENLLKAGFQVYAYNRTKSKLQPLLEKGALALSSINEAWSVADVTGIMVTNDAACKAILEEENGLLDVDSLEGKTILNCSTISPEMALQLAEKVKAKGGLYIDAPVSGSAGAAKEATLLLLIGADEATATPFLPIFNVLGKKNFFLGAVSKGNKAKIAINYLLAINYLAIGETVAFAEKLGIERSIMMDIINNGGMGNVTSKIKTEPIVSGDFSNIAFSLNNMLKDVKLAQAEGNDFPLMNGLLDAYSKAADAGFGNKDVMEILNYLNETK